MNPDGSGPTRLTDTPDAFEHEPDWQPIPINSYPRPKGATPFYGSLTIAYDPARAPTERTARRLPTAPARTPR